MRIFTRRTFFFKTAFIDLTLTPRWDCQLLHAQFGSKALPVPIHILHARTRQGIVDDDKGGWCKVGGFMFCHGSDLTITSTAADPSNPTRTPTAR
jgi:hypothetical protein